MLYRVEIERTLHSQEANNTLKIAGACTPSAILSVPQGQ